MKYKEAHALNSVFIFHQIFDHPILSKPDIPSQERSELRVTLIEEELEELREAIKDTDIIEIADALCDIQYVLSGAILEFGLADCFSELFKEVQRSNMSKLCNSIEEADRTIEYYRRQGISCNFIKKGDYYAVYRESDNKVMKSVEYSPANLKRIIDKCS